MLSRDLEPRDSKIIGQCAVCGIDLEEGTEFYIDKENNLFCSKNHVLEYYEIMEGGEEC